LQKRQRKKEAKKEKKAKEWAIAHTLYIKVLEGINIQAMISKKNYIYCLLTGALFNYYPGA